MNEREQDVLVRLMEALDRRFASRNWLEFAPIHVENDASTNALT
jgi:hypothetical protein